MAILSRVKESQPTISKVGSPLDIMRQTLVKVEMLQRGKRHKHSCVLCCTKADRKTLAVKRMEF